MQHSRSNVSFFILSGVVVLAAASVIAARLSPTVTAAQHIARDQARQLITEAATAEKQEAVVDYQLATWLDPKNRDGFIGLARVQIAAGHAEGALTALERAGEGSEAAGLRTRTLIELGRTNEAASRAADMTKPGASDADLLLAAVAYALAGRSQDITPLMPLTSSPEAAGRLLRAQAGGVPLAGELYATGLLESSRSILVKLPTSFERNLLLGHIYYERGSSTNLSTATDYLTSAVALNPSNAEAHQLLATVYADRGMAAESRAQSILAQKLTSGRP